MPLNYRNAPPTNYVAVGTALQKLRTKEGDLYLHAAAAEILAPAVLDEIQKGGLKPASKAHIRRLFTKKCRRGCDCHRPPGDDHGSLWLKDGKPHTYISQPYGLVQDQLREIVEFADAHGLRVEIGAARSFHFPGKTICVEYRREK